MLRKTSNDDKTVVRKVVVNKGVYENVDVNGGVVVEDDVCRICWR